MSDDNFKEENEEEFTCPECDEKSFTYKFQVSITIENYLDYVAGAFIDIECLECSWKAREPFDGEIEELVAVAMFGDMEDEEGTSTLENLSEEDLAKEFKRMKKENKSNMN